MSRKHKSAVMEAEVTPGPSNEVERAIAEEAGASGAVPAKRFKEDKGESSETPAEDVNAYMDKTFDVRRSFITVELPTITELKESYPELFTGKQIMQEFQRISSIDLDYALQEYCVSHSKDIADMSKKIHGASEVLKRAEAVKKDQPDLAQYWDMVTSLCLIPFLMKENLVDLVIELPEDGQVDPKGKIVPVLVSKGSVFKSDEFFLVAEEEIVQSFEEFTIAFASLFATYWVFNMEYPQTLMHSYNFMQKVMVNLKDETPIPPPCKEIQQKLQKAARQRIAKEKQK